MALSIDSTLGDVLADEKGKAVLEKHVPGVSALPGIEMAKGMTLRALAPLSQGRLTEDLLNTINDDLGKL